MEALRMAAQIPSGEKTMTVDFEGIPLKLEICFRPAEPQTRSHPGSEEEFEIERIKFPNGSDAEIYLSSVAINYIKTLADQQRKLTEWD